MGSGFSKALILSQSLKRGNDNKVLLINARFEGFKLTIDPNLVIVGVLRYFGFVRRELHHHQRPVVGGGRVKTA